jgi:cysteine desulfurase
MIYLDNNATTRPAAAVREAMAPFLDTLFANPSSPYAPACRVAVALTEAREAVASLFDAQPDQVVFTSGGTESINTAFAAATAAAPEHRHLVVSAVEHSAVLECARMYAARGYRVTTLPVDGHGQLDRTAYEAALTPDTALVSLMAANNETGVLFPLVELAEMAAARGVPFHADVTQAVGKLPLPAVSRGGPFQYVSLSAHKMHGPKGVGALVVADGKAMTPLLLGGGQEQGRRSGTENVPGIVGMGVAAQLVDAGVQAMQDTVEGLRDRLEERLLAECDEVQLVAGGVARLPNTSLWLLRRAPSDALLALLDMHDICCSAGSACASGAAEPSHVLAAMGVPREEAACALRISLSRDTTAAEVDRLVAVLPDCLAQVRAAAAI